MSKERIRYYTTLQDDFFPDSDYRLPPDYEWVRKDVPSRVLSAVVYGTALVFSSIYCRVFLKMRIKGARRLRRQRGGFFLYGNHTQPVGDVFIPALASFPKRIYTVVSPQNYALPVIGRILPYLGALPIADDLQGVRKLHSAMEYRLRDGHPIIIYPEAHIWEYYTDIRPYGEGAFKYPVKLGAPVYCMTCTYGQARIGKRPRLTVYIDGPFDAGEGSVRQRAQRLRDGVYACMKERAKLSDCRYISYIKRD
ncbi:MAG: acyl-phosphate glycerol 3-phosphate acyltransferase [Clostridia bacterium]|nr:acyl-phosphate glycerol 3-phosphate acyltransferase [Clostridia bacterium]